MRSDSPPHSSPNLNFIFRLKMPKRTSKSGTGLLNALFPGEGDAADAVDAGGGGREEGEVGVPAAALQGDRHRPGRDGDCDPPDHRVVHQGLDRPRQGLDLRQGRQPRQQQAHRTLPLLQVRLTQSWSRKTQLNLTQFMTLPK